MGVMVGSDSRWGRFYRTIGNDGEKVNSVVRAIEGGRMAGDTKHLLTF